jgi:glycosyltransferase involved in cell wall biosynthesis
MSPGDKAIPRAPAPYHSVDRVGAEQQRRINALKQFKQEQSNYIPPLAAVSESIERPFWSVMVPVYNASEAQLTQALESVLAQDPGAPYMQIAVVDDGSTMFDCEDLVTKLARGRIEFYRNERTRGLPGNWNACLQRARGFWIHILHQDDRVLSGFYERLRGPCADRRLAAAFCRGVGCDDAGKILWVQEPERESAGTLANFSAREAAVNRIVSPSIVVRRSVYEEIGGFHEGLPYCADWDLYKRIAVYGPIWYEPQCLAHWRQHDGSASARLKSAGDDLVDRRKSIELSKSYLPATIDSASAKMAFKSSLVWAAETLREALARDDFSAALAQAREILRTIEQLTGESGTRDGGANLHGQDAARLQTEVDALQAQVQAWIRAAEAIRAKYQQPRE